MMYKRTLFFILLLCSQFLQAQKEASGVSLKEFKLISDFRVSNEDDTEDVCSKWTFTKTVLETCVSYFEPITAMDKNYLFLELPCIAISRVIYKNEIYALEVNAGSHITIYNSKKIYHFGCFDTRICHKYFCAPPDLILD
jgi:hypothetical protein